MDEKKNVECDQKKSENLVKKNRESLQKISENFSKKKPENQIFFPSKTVAVVFKIQVLGTGAGRPE